MKMDGLSIQISIDEFGKLPEDNIRILVTDTRSNLRL